MKKLITFLFAISITTPLFGEIYFGGYLKNLAFRADDQISNLTRLRFETELNFAQVSTTEFWFDTELIVAKDLFLPKEKFEELSWKLIDGENYRVRQQFFRAFTKLETDHFRLTIGRQRIAWGTGFVWNPTDLFNPTDPFSLERIEKSGSNAVHFAVPIGVLSQIEAVYAIADERSSIAGKFGGNLMNYDFSAMIGKFGDDLIFGGDFAGYIGGAGFRGEFARTFDKDHSDQFRSILNIDYNFVDDFYAIAEFHFVSDLDKLHIQFATSLTKSITPLISGSLYVITDLDENGLMIAPSLIYSLSDNFDFNGSTFHFFGRSDTLFGNFPNIVLAEINFHF